VPTVPRRRVRPGAWILVVAGLVLAASATGDASVHGNDVTVLRDLVYDTGPGASATRHRADLYVPAGASSYPFVVFIHGGTWRSGDKQIVPGVLYDNVGHALAARGIGAAVINYRLTDGSADAVQHPGHVEDVARALAFARAWLNAGGVTPVDVFVMGHEAGAHLAALVATNPRFLAARGLSPADVRGVVGLAGIYDVRGQGGALDDVFGARADVRRDASPVAHVSASVPPMLLAYGSDDGMGRRGEAERFATALAGAGGSVELAGVPGRDHWSIVSELGAAEDVLIDQVVAFVRGHARPAPSPTPTLTPPATRTVVATPTSAPVAPPGQPEGGPGGRLRPHGRVDVLVDSAVPARFRLRVPADPVPGTVPVVVFLGAGGTADEPTDRAWLDHTARGGVIVVTIEYGDGGAAPAVWGDRAATALARALSHLELVGATHPDLGAVAYAGHGVGALVAADLAAGWSARGLPPPRALYLVMPRRGAGPSPEVLRRLPRDTRVLLVEGDEARREWDLEADLWDALADVPGAWRQQVVLASDRHGTPGLVADFAAPHTDLPEGAQDALDWYGTWKWLDALLACTFARRDCGFAFGGGPEQRAMGHWADGVAVTRPAVFLAPPVASTRVRFVPWARVR
jgi:acetyl esterase/lipase